MSENWVDDINAMHKKFGVHDWFKAELKKDPNKLKEFLEFRMKMVQEEVDETNEAIQHKDPEEIVDGLIDICVFAIGTLDAFGVDAYKAWDEIYNANMMKNVGDVSDSLLELHKKRKDLKKKDEQPALPGTTNNNVFVGSTADLQRMLRNDPIDVTPKN